MLLRAVFGVSLALFSTSALSQQSRLDCRTGTSTICTQLPDVIVCVRDRFNFCEIRPVSGGPAGSTWDYRRELNGSARSTSAELAIEVETEVQECKEETTGSTTMPVIITNGSKSLNEEDITFGGTVPFGVYRMYSSLNRSPGIFGSGWSSTIDYGLTFQHSLNSFCRAGMSGPTTCNTSPTGLINLYTRRPSGSVVRLTKDLTTGLWSDSDDHFVAEQDGTNWVLSQEDGTLSRSGIDDLMETMIHEGLHTVQEEIYFLKFGDARDIASEAHHKRLYGEAANTAIDLRDEFEQALKENNPCNCKYP